MGETILVRSVLTPEKVAGGEAFLRRLDEEGIPIVAAFWLFYEEAVEWRLMLATPLAEKLDYRILSRKMRAVFESMGETRLGWRDTMIVEPGFRDVKRYGYQVWKGRLSKTAIYHVEDGHRYFYRFLPLRLRG